MKLIKYFSLLPYFYLMTFKIELWALNFFFFSLPVPITQPLLYRQCYLGCPQVRFGWIAHQTVPNPTISSFRISKTPSTIRTSTQPKKL